MADSEHRKSFNHYRPNGEVLTRDQVLKESDIRATLLQVAKDLKGRLREGLRICVNVPVGDPQSKRITGLLEALNNAVEAGYLAHTDRKDEQVAYTLTKEGLECIQNCQTSSSYGDLPTPAQERTTLERRNEVVRRTNEARRRCTRKQTYT